MALPASNLSHVADSMLKDIGLALARFLAGGSVIHFHAWGETVAGFNHFFGPRTPWALPDIIQSSGLPYGKLVAVGFCLVAFTSAFALIIGLLTRLAALVSMALTICVYIFSGSDLLRELAVAYASAFIVLFLAGPGRLALDSLFRRRRTAELAGRRLA
jgi:uncharacterized membrane protein YphA (DoxX/SURF4 family)